VTPEILIALLGAILSLVFAYFPWLKDWFEALNPVYKPLLNAGLLLVLVYALFGLSCAGIVTYFACTGQGALDALVIWFYAIVANQTAYQILVRQPTRHIK
jgi:hypothetical protein